MQPSLPSAEARASRVAPAAVYPLLHIALGGAALTKCLLAEALRGAEGGAVAPHAGHHGATRGAPCRAHGGPQDLGGS